MGDSKIIVVANQKGGVGKSTICMALSNYLAKEMKFRIGGIVDMDFQQSIVKRRKTDRERNEGTANVPFYDVTAFNLDNYSRIAELIEELRKTGMIYVFDTPGRLNHQGIVVLLAMADFVIVPFNYDVLTIASTIQFLIFWNNLKKELDKDKNGSGLKAKIIFVPMSIDNRIGTAAEQVIWKEVRENYRKIGVIAPQINYSADMKRCDTMALTQKQKNIVQDTFDFVIAYIYNPNDTISCSYNCKTGKLEFTNNLNTEAIEQNENTGDTLPES